MNRMLLVHLKMDRVLQGTTEKGENPAGVAIGRTSSHVILLNSSRGHGR
jgi:hypothetical protein